MAQLVYCSIILKRIKTCEIRFRSHLHTFLCANKQFTDCIMEWHPQCMLWILILNLPGNRVDCPLSNNLVNHLPFSLAYCLPIGQSKTTHISTAAATQRRTHTCLSLHCPPPPTASPNLHDVHSSTPYFAAKVTGSQLHDDIISTSLLRPSCQNKFKLTAYWPHIGTHSSSVLLLLFPLTTTGKIKSTEEWEKRNQPSFPLRDVF